MGQFHKLAFWLKHGYERPICDGRKTWEGRAVPRGSYASKVRAGDTVEFRVSRAHRQGFLRKLRFRVAEVKKFASCRAMLKRVGVKRLLPDSDGDLSAAAELYRGLGVDGPHAAWRIDRRSLHVEEKRFKRRHWTLQYRMVQRGKEQPKLGRAQEMLLERFGRALLRAGHAPDTVSAHKDRLRFCGRPAPGAGTRGLWPWRGDDEKCRAMIRKRSEANLKKKYTTKSRAEKIKCILFAFSWLQKFTGRQSLALKGKRGATAMKGAAAKKRRR